MSGDPLIIIGAGHAAGQLVASLTQEGFTGGVTVIGDYVVKADSLRLRLLAAMVDAGTLRLVGELEGLCHRPTWLRAIAAMRQREWVVYAKRPFAGPQQVVD